MNRRAALQMGAVATVGTMLSPAAVLGMEEAAAAGFRQSLCRWCYGRIPLAVLAAEAKKVGYASIELLGNPEDVKTVQDAGLTCAVYGQVSIPVGWNRPAHHDKLVEQTKKNIDVAASFGLPAVIVMAGNRALNGETVTDDNGLKACADGLKKVLGHAEEKKVTVVMEGLNSKVDHAGYMYDKTAWGVELCKRLGSPRFKLLYDIYHMQIMEGDIIATIRRHKEWIGHFHTGGVPGRNEIDNTQELNYPAIMAAIRASGFAGFVGQEFIPKRAPLASAAEAFRICTV